MLHLRIDRGVARLTFENPSRLNAINEAMWRSFPKILDQVQDDATARVLVLQGAGDRAFCSGNDISEFENIRADPLAAAAYNALQRDVAIRFRALTKPSIAAIHGYCLGAGFELALMCDLRVCTHDAQFGVPAVRLGLPYRLEDIATILNVVGLAQAREMVLLGRRYGGEDALRLGLVNWLADGVAAMATIMDAAVADLTSAAPLSLAAARVAFQELSRRDRSPDLERAQRAADRCYASRDYAEGRAAQREKRKPVFQGN
ncbi:enoyl-CoA hydratase-related protein [Bradyrhizobium canariense]|uniref:Enoyl-CoA hydratase/carnithine racemase n=1 Tax=Bradyrhizobium canariense TaxID=255045 RepID=A0A1H1PHZ5_9BRAD|nr:enoyl-CoA hydratase-related protein [Bradyrhizobium canariense]SDS10743.1 Enoyl-CoA hydratase/carnithine racemase [Bradyrhizobium canariense]